jgi:hypothetical protein
VTRLTAAQHIFSSVPRAQSPSRRSGYQTLFYTHSGLTEADVQAIEDRALYNASDSSPVKWQCFQLPSKQMAISRIAPVDELDEFGRAGNYMAHSLVLTEEQWDDLDCGAFGVLRLRSAPFYRNLAEALARGNSHTGDIDPLVFELPTPWIETALALVPMWPADQLLLLVKLARRARELIESSQSFAVIGTPDDILDALTVALVFVKPSDRALCSFDSYTHGCKWSRKINFWAQGFAEVREAAMACVVDAARKRVILDNATKARTSPYEQWVEQIVRSGTLDNFLTYQDWAFDLDQLITGAPPALETLHQIPADFISEFAGFSQDLIQQRILTPLPIPLSPGLVRVLMARLGSSPLDLLQLLYHRHSLSDLLDIVYELASVRQAEQLREENAAVFKQLAGVHNGLSLLGALREHDVQAQQGSLDAMTKAEYRRMIRPLVESGTISSWEAFAPKHRDSWLDLCLNLLEPGAISRIASIITRQGSKYEIDQLADMVHLLTREQQTELLHWLKTSRKRAPLLQTTLEQAVGGTKTTWDRIKQRFFGHPNDARISGNRRKGQGK